jgi:myo-inositol-1(or 4)-monophosphatase
VDLRSQLDVAVDVAREAGALALSYFAAGRIDARSKGTRDVVTAADLASEELMVRRLSSAFPNDGLVAEEGSRTVSRGRRRWFLDPIDGTLNYSRGIPIWCVSIGLFDGAEPIIGVVHDPMTDETFAAGRGIGACCNGSPIHCGYTSRAADAVVHLTVDFQDHSLPLGLADMQALAPRVLRTRNLGAVALALAYAAANRLDAVIHRYAHTWDYAAGVLLVREAGGVVSGLDGGPFVQSTSALLAAATPELHAALLDLVPGPDSAEVS